MYINILALASKVLAGLKKIMLKLVTLIVNGFPF